MKKQYELRPFSFENQEGVYFITFSTVDWVRLFHLITYQQIILQSIAYCQSHKGLILYAWVIMPTHLHLIARAESGKTLPDILRDLKKHTSRQVLQKLLESPITAFDLNCLKIFNRAGINNPHNTHYQVWQNDNHPIELWSDNFFDQKLNYLHENPVKAGLVDTPQDYALSSARDYYENQKGLLAIRHIYRIY